MRALYRSFCVCATSGLLSVGCGSGRNTTDSAVETGELALPLTTAGPSGTTYRLNAEFELTCQYDCGSELGVAGTGNWNGGSFVVSTEDYPDEASITIDLERGEYRVRLLDGWEMQEVTDEGAETVDAVLLSSMYYWVYVSPHSTTWASWEFGIGDRAMWFNGEMNIQFSVHEDPDEYYGTNECSDWCNECDQCAEYNDWDDCDSCYECDMCQYG